LTTPSNGQGVDLRGCNLRMIVKGYSEALTDADGAAHGEGFGVVLADYSRPASNATACTPWKRHIGKRVESPKPIESESTTSGARRSMPDASGRSSV